MDEAERLVRFCHPAKILAGTRLPNALGRPEAARLHGLSLGAYSALVERLEQRARAAAARLGPLPFARGDRVLALGDSITDDLCSWAEMLRWTGHVQVLNAGLSGDTTTGAIARVGRLAAWRPDWTLILLGTNDARRHGRERGDVLVSDPETIRNVTVLDRAARAISRHVVWITPPPVDEERIRADPGLIDADLLWVAADVAAKANCIRAAGAAVDLWPAFGSPRRSGLLLDDGLHPSISGQLRIAEALVAALAETAPLAS